MERLLCGAARASRHLRGLRAKLRPRPRPAPALPAPLQSGRARAAECGQSGTPGQTLGWARARVDCLPSPYDTAALALRAGEVVRVLDRRPGGLWLGEAAGRTGTFKFTQVEEVVEPGGGSVCQLLAQLCLSHLAARLELNGWERVEQLAGLSNTELDMLEVMDWRDRETLLTASAVVRSLLSADQRIHFASTAVTVESAETAETEEKSKEGREEEQVLEPVDCGYPEKFTNTLALFDSAARPRLVPICGLRGGL